MKKRLGNQASSSQKGKEAIEVEDKDMKDETKEDTVMNLASNALEETNG